MIQLRKHERHYPSTSGLNRTIVVVQQRRLCHQITHEGWYIIKRRNEKIKPQKIKHCILGKLVNFIFVRHIGPAVRVFANGPGDLGSIPDRVIPKTLKMELDTTLLNTKHYKVRFKGKVEQSREWSSALPYTLV